MTDRLCPALKCKVMSAECAAALIPEGAVVGFSGFSVAGTPNAVAKAIAAQGTAKNMTLITGASVSDELDGGFADAGLISRRYPYQSAKALREQINTGKVMYSDMHLSSMPSLIGRAAGQPLDFAVIEAVAVTGDGIIPSLSVGASDCLVGKAHSIIVELNTALPVELCGMHDIPADMTQCTSAPINITDVLDRIGMSFIPCAPSKIVAVVITDELSVFPEFKATDSISEAIGANVVRFLKHEIKEGRIPQQLWPIQSGVGSTANAVLKGLAKSGLTNLRMYTEVLQDSALELIRDGHISGASTTSITLSKEMFGEFAKNIDYYKRHIIMRPQELSNNPEVVRRLKVVALNTPIECDIYGNVNSTHIMGSSMMNGIGGSGDFARNAGLTIFATASVAKGGRISCIVPMCSHIDHTEHDVMVIITEQGVADLRWKSPRERAECIIENCAHPKYRDELRSYFTEACLYGGHTPHVLSKAFSFHQRYMETGSMSP